MCPAARRPHDGDDLLDGERVGRVTDAVVAWRATGMVAGDGRRATAGGIEQQLVHDLSSGSTGSQASLRRPLESRIHRFPRQSNSAARAPGGTVSCTESASAASPAAGGHTRR